MSSSSVSGSTSSSSGIITPTTISGSGGLTSSSTLTNNGAGGQLQITGLASGINTNQLIQAELAVKELPLTNMQDTITSLNEQNTQLSDMQTLLQSVSFDALDLSMPSLFFQSQTVTSSDTSLVTAAPTKNIGAVIGSSTVSVAALASASHATFAYTAPTSGGDTLTIGNDQGTQQVTVTTGESNTNIANDINGDNNGIAYATVLSNGQLVISSRTTGDGSSTGTGDGNPITLSSANSGAITATSSQAGVDSEVYVNGSTTPSYSQNDTLTDAVPGVTLTLIGVTPANAPVTITTGAPADNTKSIVTAVQQFVNDYNNAIAGIQSAINTAPASESNSSAASAYSGSLFGDPQLESMISNIRAAMDATDSSLTSGYQSMAELGISTGASNGSANANSNAGILTVNTDTLTAAIEANPSAVQAALASWSSQLQTTVNQSSGPFGSLQSRISGNNTEITSLNSQLSTEQEMYNNEEKALEQQWAKVEATLSQLDNQKTSLTSFAGSLASSSSSSKG
ncbi:MAG TPA: flagellar filament capping protein FliD [Solirubrobacteraceae bacterium]|nr:flagellar filament capping protein FliD [Solirubrobacteraceae bacterium]